MNPPKVMLLSAKPSFLPVRQAGCPLISFFSPTIAKALLLKKQAIREQKPDFSIEYQNLR